MTTDKKDSTALTSSPPPRTKLNIFSTEVYEAKSNIGWCRSAAWQKCPFSLQSTLFETQSYQNFYTWMPLHTNPPFTLLSPLLHLSGFPPFSLAEGQRPSSQHHTGLSVTGQLSLPPSLQPSPGIPPLSERAQRRGVSERAAKRRMKTWKRTVAKDNKKAGITKKDREEKVERAL